jgi:alkylhydroperoxidase family enzyme
MSRIPYPDFEKLSPAKQELFKLGPKLLNVSKMSMHAPDAPWASQRALAQSFLTPIAIEKRLREHVILLVAYLSNSEYEIYHHESIAAGIGIGEDVIAALKAGDFSAFAPLERAVCQFVWEIVLNVSPTDETLAAIRAQMSDERMMEIVFLVGSYMMTARAAAVTGADFEETPSRGL